MLNPTELLVLAQQLSDHPNAPSRISLTANPTEAELRRAVSTAYYALFHTVLQAAADSFVGGTRQATPAYSLIYRGFDHLHMKRGCEDVLKSTFSGAVQRALKRTSISQPTRDFATAFVELQTSRHLADYEPTNPFAQIDVLFLVDSAAVGMQAFAVIPPDEQLDILAFLLVKSR